ncbi:MAG: hypothetical protein HYX33_03450 [Actinobacteria bacterium]|nr:hypothetical protein [Actinomycetota bacterium]
MTDDAIARGLDVTGVAIPRGALGDDRFAAIVRGDVAVDAASLARASWPEFRLPIEAALQGAFDRAMPEVAEAVDAVLDLASDDDPDNPLSRVLAARAWRALTAAALRAHASIASLVDDATPENAARVAGRIVIDLLDLDADDYEAEIGDYVEHDGTSAALSTLAAATGDEDIRAWARLALASVLATVPVPSAEALHALFLDGDPPADPDDDALWLAASHQLAEIGIELALATEATRAAEA